MALGMMIDGEWRSTRSNEDKGGRFVRPSTTFRDWIRADGSSDFAPEAGRYHLYVSYACPWAHRTLILRKLKGLEDAIGVSVVDPYMGEDGWFFSDAPGAIRDSVYGFSFVREIYKKADPNFTGRVTVPILWDKKNETVVNNESREIIKMLDLECGSIAAKPDVNFYPADLAGEIETALDAIYNPINNGVYRSGFASTQAAYEEAVTELFEALDHWESVLGHRRYLCGDRITHADWCLFTTLFRFDAVYYVHFKTNIRRIVDYPNLWSYVKELYQIPGVAETCHMGHIKEHYYTSHESVNPRRIVPKGPVIDFNEPHNRG
ncbi:MAG: glutathione S-transferase family protein [bacterium]|nr:glutathione S-transferase family protein [bacterium]